MDDYTVPYSVLRYKYKDDYRQILEHRAEEYEKAEHLLAQNGMPLRFRYDGSIREKLGEIYELLDETPITDSAETVMYEGLSSSVIEGARTTVADTIKLAKGKKRPCDKSEQMVWNNMTVIDKYYRTPFPFTEDALIGAWRVMVDKVCENEDVRGEKYRGGTVVIADGMGNVIYTPPDYKRVREYMDRLFAFIAADNYEPLIKAILIHYYFAYVHPFCDGNGRMARFISQQWLIQNERTQAFQYISLSVAVNDNRSAYYRALQNSENELNDVTYFVLFYLDVMKLQLNRSIELFGANDEFNERQRSILVKINQGGITRKKYAGLYGVSPTTAGKDLNALVRCGDLKRAKEANGEYRYYKVVL